MRSELLFAIEYWAMLRKHHRAAFVISTKAVLSPWMLAFIPVLFVLGEVFLRRHEGAVFLWNGGTEYSILFLCLSAFVALAGVTLAPALAILDAMPSRWHWSAPAIYVVGNTYGMISLSLYIGDQLNMSVADLPTPFEIAAVSVLLNLTYRSLTHGKMTALVQEGKLESTCTDAVDAAVDTIEAQSHGKYSNVILIRARDHYCEMFSAQDCELVRCPLSELEGRMGHQLGLRVHRSFWVSFSAIGQLEDNSRAPRIRLASVPERFDGEFVPVARTRREQVAQIIAEHNVSKVQKAERVSARAHGRQAARSHRHQCASVRSSRRGTKAQSHASDDP